METNAEISRLLQALAKAIETGDGTALADCFTDDGIYEDYFFGAKQGRQGMVDMIAHFKAGARNFRWEFFDPVSDGKRGYARYRFSYDSLQPQAVGVRVGFDGISCIELRDGRISHYREVFDRGMALAQQNFEPAHIARLAMKYAARLREAPEWAPHFDAGIIT